MGIDYNMQQEATPAAGGVQAPREQQPMLQTYPEDIPNLTDATARPQEPITDGLAIGAGRGPEALLNRDPRMAETRQLKRWLPLLDPIANDPTTPDSVRTLVRYIRAS
jgi:hypothetical protein